MQRAPDILGTNKSPHLSWPSQYPECQVTVLDVTPSANHSGCSRGCSWEYCAVARLLEREAIIVGRNAGESAKCWPHMSGPPALFRFSSAGHVLWPDVVPFHGGPRFAEPQNRPLPLPPLARLCGFQLAKAPRIHDFEGVSSAV